MKRNKFCLMLVTALLLVFSFPVYAVNTSKVELEELDMSIELPSDYIVFTRDIDSNDPILSEYGFTKDSLLSEMESKDLYLSSWNQELDYEIYITMQGSQLEDYNQLSDTMLSTLASSFGAEYESLGITIDKYEVYEHEQANFIKIYISQPNGDSTTYGIQYNTVYANKSINITLQSYSGKVTAEVEGIAKSMIDSITFGSDPELENKQLESSKAYEYTDPETKISFTVPANWSEEEPREKSENNKVNFISNVENGLFIQYSNVDAGAEVDSNFSKDDIAELYGISSSEVETVTYGSKEYFKVAAQFPYNMDGITFSPTITQVFRFDNGYMHVFQFLGTEEHPLYKDFEVLLESVHYPSEAASFVENDSLTFGTFLFSFIITITIYTVPIIVYRYLIRKKPVESKTAKKITIAYGVAAFIMLSILIFALGGTWTAGSAIILWSYVNYRMLVAGKPGQTDEEVASVK